MNLGSNACAERSAILACHEAGITVFVPKTLTSGAIAAGRFGKDDFIYDASANEYRCPAGQSLIWRFSSVEKGLKLHRYWSSHCQSCMLKERCTPSSERRVSRWEHESVVEAMQSRLDQAPEMMRIRRQTVEHPFGTLKSWMGATHFLTRTLARVSTEMSLHLSGVRHFAFRHWSLRAPAISTLRRLGKKKRCFR